MRRLTKAQKRKARRTQKHMTQAAAAGGFAALAVAAAIPGIGALIALGPGAVAALLTLRADVLGDLVMDPPRKDFQEASYIPESRLQLDELRESPTGESATPLLIALDETTRSQEGLLMAVERSQGAELAGDLASAASRQNEAYLHAERVATYLTESSVAAIAFAGALEDYRDTPIKDRFQISLRLLVDSGSLLDSLPSQTHFLMIQAGIPIRRRKQPRLRLPLRELISDQPVRTFISTLHDVAETDREYAEFLRLTASERTLFEPGDGSGPGEGQSPTMGGQDSGPFPA